MNIFAIARTYNEEKNIEFYIKNYYWCDIILLSDGGSTDKTLEIAQKYNKVKIIHFPIRIECMNNSNLTMNPENAHFNSLVNAAIDLGADWVVYDDVDSAPNYLLHQTARKTILESKFPEIYVRRFYMWHFDRYFPELTSDNPTDNSGHSFWAWKPKEINIRGDLSQDPYNMHYFGFGDAKNKTYIQVPECLIHYSWPTDKMVEYKMNKYNAWGRPQNHPLSAFGPNEQKLEFMRCQYSLEPYYEN